MALRAKRDPHETRRLEATGFELLLVALDADRERAGEKYELLRLRLMDFFAWRGARRGDELADDTIDRVSRRLASGEAIRLDLSRYVLGVARNVLREAWAHQRRSAAEQRLAAVAEPVAAAEPDGDREQISCLERCLAQMEAADRELLLRYYEGEGAGRIAGRQALAAALGLAPGALRIKLHRLRARLEGCIRGCLGPAETPLPRKPPIGEE